MASVSENGPCRVRAYETEATLMSSLPAEHSCIDFKLDLHNRKINPIC